MTPEARSSRASEVRKAKFRCAIYTRVSSDAGLEQDFNSLDNQREAAEAYIKSQAHEGWILSSQRYDDGGFSGGSLERPALQSLLDAVRQRRIEVIVVYKVDRLTRSLADFAKLVELFDAHGVSFVSVTQAFNTTTSMGRLTLNVLLSFAQFEREVTGERIRDKIAASKKKGLWMGGVVPLGYRVENRALLVVDEHADFIRAIYRRYLELGSVVRLKAAFDAEGIKTPIRVNGTGRTTGGACLSRGHLYWILSNPIYIGRLKHKRQVHTGLHQAIVDEATWQQVQARLASQTQPRRGAMKDEQSFLAGKLFDDRGNLMGASFAAKRTRRWRYYVSRAALTGRAQDVGAIARVSAPKIEALVASAVQEQLAPREGGTTPKCESSLSDRASNNASGPTRRWGPPDTQITSAIERVTLGDKSIEIVLAEAAAIDERSRTIILEWMPVSSRRRREIVQTAESSGPQPMRAMRAGARNVFVRALADARRWLEELTEDSGASVAAIAARKRKSERTIRMTLSLAFLDPLLASSALEGELPRGFNRTRLIDLPMLWSEQWQVVGLRPPAVSAPV